jgi:hypothetical protein
VLLPLGCMLLARAFSNREVRRAILAGLAPSYQMSPDTTWWWDGARWVGTGAGAPRCGTPLSRWQLLVGQGEVDRPPCPPCSLISARPGAREEPDPGVHAGDARVA